MVRGGRAVREPEDHDEVLLKGHSKASSTDFTMRYRATTQAPPPDESAGYVAVNPDASLTVPPFENSGWTQKPPLAI
jgi:hypothetical protein